MSSIIAQQYLENTQMELAETSQETMLLLSILKDAKVPISRELYPQMIEFIEHHKILIKRVRSTIVDSVKDSDEIISDEQTKLFAQQIQQAGDIEANLLLAEIELHNNQLLGGLQYRSGYLVKTLIRSNPKIAEGLGNGFYKTILEEVESSGGRRRRKSTRRKRTTSRKK